MQAALQATAPQTILAVVLVVTSAISAAYYLTVVSAMFMRPRTPEAPAPGTTSMAYSLVAVAAVAILALGVYPTPVTLMARRALSSAATSLTSPAAPAPAGTRLQAASLDLSPRASAAHGDPSSGRAR